MSEIHPSAVVSPNAKLGNNVIIGPFCVVEEGSEIGDGCRLETGAVVKGRTTLGADNIVHEYAILGGTPQHLKAGDDIGGVVIGSGNTFREHVTVHAALDKGENTIIGNGNLLMVNVHIAHDCHVGDRTIIANNVMLAGHITIESCAYLSGAVAIHQFVRIGGYAMVGGQAHIKQDVPPYVTVDGKSSKVVGLNLIGLRRQGFQRNQIRDLKAAYRLIYRSDLKFEEMLAALKREYQDGPAQRFGEFLSGGERGFIQERRENAAKTTQLRTDDELRKAG